ncbi:MAG TPA: hypothetical protein VIM16_10525 [Mucilaginibacter sp.]
MRSVGTLGRIHVSHFSRSVGTFRAEATNWFAPFLASGLLSTRATSADACGSGRYSLRPRLARTKKAAL